jgi:hypothetical protein
MKIPRQYVWAACKMLEHLPTACIQFFLHSVGDMGMGIFILQVDVVIEFMWIN